MSPAHALHSLERFRTIDLAELNAHAELQTRVDRKYILPACALASVLRALPSDTRVLEHLGEHAPRYLSHYFDTPDLQSFFGAARGRRRQFKVRPRRYVDSQVAFLEVKTRGGRSLTVKDRVDVSDSDARHLDPEGTAYAEGVLTEAGIAGAAIAPRLRRELTTRYRRVTLLLPAHVPDASTAGGRDASRMTIDIDLGWVDAASGSTLNLPDAVIVETKSGRSAGPADRALWAHGIRPATLSKYGTGLAALRSDLPANKWRRVLDSHFRNA
ncbi:polyphosphate polymerase domain-containing protein [Microbacterium sp.]|uniref:polyphosphate polymerase domain-containing protein n=1 Tax=Microbacterium sp. TaxID=51671 RepID=UPI0025E5FA5B|nr:polyphosphate polymerase domain-containing protein [Microbacterium sp.]